MNTSARLPAAGAAPSRTLASDRRWPRPARRPRRPCASRPSRSRQTPVRRDHTGQRLERGGTRQIDHRATLGVRNQAANPLRGFAISRASDQHTLRIPRPHQSGHEACIVLGQPPLCRAVRGARCNSDKRPLRVPPLCHQQRVRGISSTARKRETRLGRPWSRIPGHAQAAGSTPPDGRFLSDARQRATATRGEDRSHIPIARARPPG